MDYLLALPPGLDSAVSTCQLTLAQMRYRIGPGPRLMGTCLEAGLRGGLLMVDCRDYDGQGDPAPCSRQLVSECCRRGYSGIVCDFEGPPTGCLPRLASLLNQHCAAQGLRLYLPEIYAAFAPAARLLIPSAVVSGTLERQLCRRLEQHPPERLTLAVEWLRVDFPLPATGRGVPLTQAQLEEQLGRLQPAVCFDKGLCAHYYTYMAPGGQAHLVLFDTPRSIREKLVVARRLGLGSVLLPGPEVAPHLSELFQPL